MSSTLRIAFIGAGNMGGSLIAGLCACGYPGDHIWATDPNPEKLQTLKKNNSINILTDNKEAVHNADIVIVAVKPDKVSVVLQEVAAIICHTKRLVVSIAAGVSIKKMVGALTDEAVTQVSSKDTGDIPIIRAMPNTPSQLRCGATGLYANHAVTSAQKDFVDEIFKSVGVNVWVDKEADLDIVTAISGSGPAYFFLFIEIMQNAAVEMGLSPDAAKQLATQTAFGAAKMARDANLTDIVALRNQVTSKGGTTEAAITALERENIRQLFSSAINAARHRAQELGS